MVKLFSRNTKVKNVYSSVIIVEARQDPGNFQLIKLVIQPAEHAYLCYEDLHSEYNPDRPVRVFFYLQDARESGEGFIALAAVRDNEKLELCYQNGGAFTVTPIEGHVILRLGLSIKLRHLAAEMIKVVGGTD